MLQSEFLFEWTCSDCNISGHGKKSYAGHRSYCKNRKSISEYKNAACRRSAMIKKYGHKCTICQLTHWQGKLAPIQLDHIDGNSDNNEESNLRLLCANCHAQTETFCGKNIGRFKTIRNSTRKRGHNSMVESDASNVSV